MSISFSDSDYSYEKNTIDEFLQYNTPIYWSDFFKKKEVEIELQKISLYLYGKNDIYPSMRDLFRVFYLIKPEDIRVVVLGQDPYYNGSADGIAFSSRDKICQSLKNIILEVKNCGYTCQENIGSLTCWVKSGVLLINTALTVEKDKPESHLKLWKKFTSLLLQYIDENYNVVYLLWGNKAKKFIDTGSLQKSVALENKKNYVYTSHPSPLSCRRGFLNSKCFIEVNKILQSLGKKEIDWNIKNIY